MPARPVARLDAQPLLAPGRAAVFDQHPVGSEVEMLVCQDWLVIRGAETAAMIQEASYVVEDKKVKITTAQGIQAINDASSLLPVRSATR